MQKIFYNSFFLMLFSLSVVWVRSSYGKITGGKFVDTLAATLTKTSATNPYPFFKSFLQNIAIPNAKIFGNLTMYGELLVAISLSICSLYLLFKPNNNIVLIGLALGLAGGAFLNAIFWLSFGATSPSTDSLNMLMFFMEIVGLITVAKLLTA